MPVASTQLPDANPADRFDPIGPVPEADCPKLPRRSQAGKLDRAAFVHHGESGLLLLSAGPPVGVYAGQSKEPRKRY